MTSNYSIPLLSNETYNNQESAFYSHSLNMKTRKLGIFRKSPRPSLLIKRAALGNLKTSFHCTHWHHFFPLKKEFFRIPPSPFSQRELHFLPKPLSMVFTPPSVPPFPGDRNLRKRGCNRPPVLRTATL